MIYQTGTPGVNLMSINKLAALVLSFVVAGCNATTTTTVGEATTAITIHDPIIGENQHGVQVPLSLLEVCPLQGDPYGDALFYGRVTMNCGAHVEVITIY